jgi:hypothetical protein
MNSAYDFKSKLMSRESGGTYVSKPGKNACMTSNHCIYVFELLQEESLIQQDCG